MSAHPITLPQLRLQLIANRKAFQAGASQGAPSRALASSSIAHLRPHLVARSGGSQPLAALAERSTVRPAHAPLRLVQACAEPVPLELPAIQRTVEPGLAFYRKYTERLLARYMKLSFEHGRVSSLLGRELFPGNVTSCKVQAFDDVVIFVHDVERCLQQLAPGLRHLVRRIALEQYTHVETAEMLGICRQTVSLRYAEAIDKLTRLLLDRKLLEPTMAEACLNDPE